MELNYNELTKVSLEDLVWAYNSGYERDVKWLALNVVSLFSDDLRQTANKKSFRKVMGVPMYRNQNYNWSTGCYEDIINLVTKITSIRHYDKTTVERQIDSLTHFTEDYELSIRVRNFYNCSRILYGQSSKLKQDYDGGYYMWDYNSYGTLTQIPEQLLKERLILWDNRESLVGGE